MTSDKPASMVFQRVDEQHPFRKLRHLDKTIDIVLCVGSERIRAHRLVLAAASPYFESMFYNGMKESRQDEVVLGECDAVTWTAVVNFIYGEAVDYSGAEYRKVVELLRCAKYCQLDHLEREVAGSVGSSVDESNCCDMLMLALEMGNDELKTTVLKFVAEHFVSLCDAHVFGSLDAEAMEEIVRCSTLKVRGEIDVLRAIINWLTSKNDSKNDSDIDDSETTENLVKHLRIDHLGLDDLREVGLLARKSKLTSVETSCIEAFFNLKDVPGAMLLGTPIPVSQRFLRERISPMFTVSYRLQVILKTSPYTYSSFTISANPAKSPWLPGLGDSLWQFEVRVGQQVQVFVRGINVPVIVNHFITDHHVSIQLFAQNVTKKKWHIIGDGQSKLVKPYEWSWMDFMTNEEFKNFLERRQESASTVFGATIQIRPGQS